jgi:hypothetical protein
MVGAGRLRVGASAPVRNLEDHMNILRQATRWCCVAAAGAVTSLTVATASGATINVTTTSMSSSPSGCGFLEALASLNNQTSVGGCTAGNGSNDIINLPAGTYTATGTLNVYRSVEIRGAGVGQTIVRGNLSSDVSLLYVSPNYPAPVPEFAWVVLQDLTVDKSASQSVPNASGIWGFAAGETALVLQLYRVHVKGHTWGGVYTEGVGLEVWDSVIEGNSSPTAGGGIASFNTWGQTGSTNVFYSTIRNNTSDSHGGGIYHAAQGNSHLDHSTVSGNTASWTGGGVALNATADYFQMDYSTIAFNTATTGGGVSSDGLGNYYVFSTIFSDNWFADWGGYVTVMENSLVQEESFMAPINPADLENNVFGVSANLDPSLADLGGPYHTPVHRLLPGSPAIDHDDSCVGSLENQDQRHFPRGINGDGVSGPVCDIGAFEHDPNWQTETLLVAAKSSDSHTVVNETNYSNGAATRLASNAIGDFVTYAVPVPATGNYNVKVRVKRSSDRGRFQLGVASSPTGTVTNIGSVQDLYAASSSFVELNVSNSTSLSSGMKYFRFRVEGKNAASSGYVLALDTIKLTKL